MSTMLHKRDRLLSKSDLDCEPTRDKLNTAVLQNVLKSTEYQLYVTYTIKAMQSLFFFLQYI